MTVIDGTTLVDKELIATTTKEYHEREGILRVMIPEFGWSLSVKEDWIVSVLSERSRLIGKLRKYGQYNEVFLYDRQGVQAIQDLEVEFCKLHDRYQAILETLVPVDHANFETITSDHAAASCTPSG